MKQPDKGPPLTVAPFVVIPLLLATLIAALVLLLAWQLLVESHAAPHLKVAASTQSIAPRPPHPTPPPPPPKGWLPVPYEMVPGVTAQPVYSPGSLDAPGPGYREQAATFKERGSSDDPMHRGGLPK